MLIVACNTKGYSNCEQKLAENSSKLNSDIHDNHAYHNQEDELPGLPTDNKPKFTSYSAHFPSKPSSSYYQMNESYLSEQFPDNPRVTFIVHGFMSANLSAYVSIKDALLSLNEIHLKPDVVVIVDWRKLSCIKCDLSIGYDKAAKNTRRVGREVAYVLCLLRKHRNLDPAKVHLIGFSLGAHVVGVAGRKAVLSYNLPEKVGRISGLDPAGPYFEDYVGYLDRDDATFVDIIHTNGGNKILKGQFGMEKAVGHIDFYPNGGSQQIDCRPDEPECSHNRALAYYEASISHRLKCKYNATCCNSCDNDKAKKSATKCCLNSSEMGFYSFKNSARGRHCLATTNKEPYCNGMPKDHNHELYFILAMTGFTFSGIAILIALLLAIKRARKRNRCEPDIAEAPIPSLDSFAYCLSHRIVRDY